MPQGVGGQRTDAESFGGGVRSTDVVPESPGSEAEDTWRPTVPRILATPPIGFRAPLDTPPALVLPVPESGSVGTLTVLHGCEAGKIFTLDSDATIGRSPTCAVWIDDTSVSRAHARILRVGDNRYVVEDLGSTNGTYIGEHRIARAELVQGVRLQVGPTVMLRFALVDPSDEVAQRDLFLAATRDPLTGAFNRRYFDERLRVEVARARRGGSPLALALLDVDDLKGINDEHGHLTGDRVLASVGSLLRNMIRCEDVLARWGGDELVLLAPATDAADAEVLAERLRTASSALPIDGASPELRVTLSMGIATLDELAVDAGGADLIARADARLYRAKRAGKNCVLSS
jgi:diguanylate cyclase (GGDEF)-like protein